MALFLGFLILILVAGLLVGAHLLKGLWPSILKEKEPDLGQAFRYVSIAVFLLLWAIFVLLLLLLPGPNRPWGLLIPSTHSEVISPWD